MADRQGALEPTRASLVRSGECNALTSHLRCRMHIEGDCELKIARQLWTRDCRIHRARRQSQRRRNTGRFVPRATWALAILMGITSFLCAERVSAHVCGDRSWTYAVSSIQEARRRLNSTKIQLPSNRVLCAKAILDDPGLAQPDDECRRCAVEFVGLLSDSAVYMRQAAVATRDEENRQAFLDDEVKTRERLRDFLTEPAQRDIAPRYFESNLLALGDAMNRRKLARKYHEMMMGLDAVPNRNPELYRLWTRAIRSCSAWDFSSGDNLDRPKLRERLCDRACIEDFADFYQGLREAGLITGDQAVRGLPPFPKLSDCTQTPAPAQ